MSNDGICSVKGENRVLKKGLRQKYGLTANIELEYPIPQDSAVVAEMKKCFAFVKQCLA